MVYIGNLVSEFIVKIDKGLANLEKVKKSISNISPFTDKALMKTARAFGMRFEEGTKQATGALRGFMKNVNQITYMIGHYLTFTIGVQIVMGTIRSIKNLVNNIMEFERAATNATCYDEETEVLTKDGWKYWRDVGWDDRFATINPETFKLEYHKPSLVFKQDYEGPMYRIKTGRIDLKVTPHHKMLIRRRNGTKFELVKAYEIAGKTVEYVTGGIKWKGESPEYFILPEVRYTRTFYGREIIRDARGRMITSIPNLSDKHIKEYIIPSRKIPIKDWLEFFGLWLAEGSIAKDKKGSYKILFTNYNPDIREKYWQIIERITGRTYKRHNRKDIAFYNKQIYEYLKQFNHATSKYIPQFIKELSPELLKIFLNAYMLGDGSKRKRSLFTSSIRLRDDLEEIIMKIGWAVSHYKKLSIGEEKYIAGRKITASADGWAININRTQLTPLYDPSRKNKSHKETYEWYKGRIYCVEVPYHTLFVRRNGKTVWSGNTVSGHLGASFDSVKKHIMKVSRELGRTTVFTATDAANAFYDLACLPPDELILDGNYCPRKAIDISIGDYVIGKSGTPTKVLKVFSRPCVEGELIHIKPYYVKDFRVTPNHPLLVIKPELCKYQTKSTKSKRYCKPTCDWKWRNKECEYFNDYKPEWVDAGDLKENYYLLIPKISINKIYKINWHDYGKYNLIKSRIKLPEKVDEEFAYFLGRFMADGWITESNDAVTIIFNDEEIEVMNKIERYIHSFGLSTWKRTEGKTIKLSFSSRLMVKFLKRFIGKYAPNKKIPSFMFTSPNNIVKSFLKGYIDGDGHLNKYDYPSYHTSSDKINFSINLLFAKISGIAAQTYCKGKYSELPSGWKGETKDSWQGRVNSNIIAKELGYDVKGRQSNKFLYFPIDNYIAIPIHSIEREEYHGKVYNIETEDNTFMTTVVTHNSAGYDVANIGKKELLPILNYAAATQISLEQATYAVTVAVKQFGLEMKDTARIADVFVAGITNSYLNAERLREGMKYLGPIMGSLGKSIEETVALLGALADVGFEGGQSGRYLSLVIARLLEPTEKAKKVFESMGLTMEDINPELHSIVDILLRLKEAGFDASKATAAFGTRSAKAAIGIVRAAEEVGQLYTILQSSGGLAQSVAEKQIKTLWGSFKLLKSALQEVGLSMEGFVIPILVGFADFIRKDIIPGLKLTSSLLGSLSETLGLVGGNARIFASAMSMMAAGAFTLWLTLSYLGTTLTSLGLQVWSIGGLVRASLPHFFALGIAFGALSQWGDKSGKTIKRLTGIIFGIILAVDMLTTHFGRSILNLILFGKTSLSLQSNIILVARGMRSLTLETYVLGASVIGLLSSLGILATQWDKLSKGGRAVLLMTTLLSFAFLQWNLSLLRLGAYLPALGKGLTYFASRAISAKISLAPLTAGIMGLVGGSIILGTQWDNLSKSAKALTIGFMALSSAIAYLNIQQVLHSFGSLTSVFTQQSVVIAGLTLSYTQLSLAIASTAIGSYLIIKHWDDLGALGKMLAVILSVLPSLFILTAKAADILGSSAKRLNIAMAQFVGALIIASLMYEAWKNANNLGKALIILSGILVGITAIVIALKFQTGQLAATIWSTGIGAIIGALGLLAYWLITDKNALEKFMKVLKVLFPQFYILIQILKEAKREWEMIGKFIGSLTSKIGPVRDFFKTLGDWIDKVKKKLKEWDKSFEKFLEDWDFLPKKTKSAVDTISAFSTQLAILWMSLDFARDASIKFSHAQEALRNSTSISERLIDEYKNALNAITQSQGAVSSSLYGLLEIAKSYNDKTRELVDSLMNMIDAEYKIEDRQRTASEYYNDMLEAQTKYSDAVAIFGESSSEAKNALNGLLRAQEQYRNITDEISDLQSTVIEGQTKLAGYWDRQVGESKITYDQFANLIKKVKEWEKLSNNLGVLEAKYSAIKEISSKYTETYAEKTAELVDFSKKLYDIELKLKKLDDEKAKSLDTLAVELMKMGGLSKEQKNDYISLKRLEGERIKAQIKYNKLLSQGYTEDEADRISGLSEITQSYNEIADRLGKTFSNLAEKSIKSGASMEGLEEAYYGWLSVNTEDEQIQKELTKAQEDRLDSFIDLLKYNARYQKIVGGNLNANDILENTVSQLADSLGVTSDELKEQIGLTSSSSGILKKYGYTLDGLLDLIKLEIAKTQTSSEVYNELISTKSRILELDDSLYSTLSNLISVITDGNISLSNSESAWKNYFSIIGNEGIPALQQMINSFEELGNWLGRQQVGDIVLHIIPIIPVENWDINPDTGDIEITNLDDITTTLLLGLLLGASGWSIDENTGEIIIDADSPTAQLLMKLQDQFPGDWSIDETSGDIHVPSTEALITFLADTGSLPDWIQLITTETGEQLVKLNLSGLGVTITDWDIAPGLDIKKDTDGNILLPPGELIPYLQAVSRGVGLQKNISFDSKTGKLSIDTDIYPDIYISEDDTKIEFSVTGIKMISGFSYDAISGSISYTGGVDEESAISVDLLLSKLSLGSTISSYITDKGSGILDLSNKIGAGLKIDSISNLPDSFTISTTLEVVDVIMSERTVREKILAIINAAAAAGTAASQAVLNTINEVLSAFRMETVPDLATFVLLTMGQMKKWQVGVLFEKLFGYRPPGWQTGGFITKPTLGWVAETGPEAVIPLRNLNDYLSPIEVVVRTEGAGDINIYGDIRLENVTDVESLIEELTKYRYRYG